MLARGQDGNDMRVTHGLRDACLAFEAPAEGVVASQIALDDLQGFGVARYVDDPRVAPLKQLVDVPQQKDGAWQVPYQGFSSKKKPNPRTLTPVYQYWGTTWATIGLARTLPR